jgi:hypothetical protein
MSGKRVSRCFTTLLVVAAALAMGATSANATVIDDFTTTNATVFAPYLGVNGGTNPTPASFLTTPGTGAGTGWTSMWGSLTTQTVGGQVVELPSGSFAGRTTAVTGPSAGNTATYGNGAGSLSVGIAAGVFSTHTGLSSVLTITDSAALSVLSSGSIVMHNVVSDHATPFTITLTDTNSKTATYTGSIPITLGTTLTISMSDPGWSFQSGFLLGSITGEAFAFANPTAEDLTLGELDATEGVPEPFSLLIWSLAGLGGIGTVVVSRRRR